MPEQETKFTRSDTQSPEEAIEKLHANAVKIGEVGDADIAEELGEITITNKHDFFKVYIVLAKWRPELLEQFKDQHPDYTKLLIKGDAEQQSQISRSDELSQRLADDSEFRRNVTRARIANAAGHACMGSMSAQEVTDLFESPTLSPTDQSGTFPSEEQESLDHQIPPQGILTQNHINQYDDLLN